MSTTTRTCPDEIARIKSAASIVSVIAETLPLTRNGKIWVSRCPFHAERTPSFAVYPGGHFHCFGCGAHGDVIRWLMVARRMTFGQATAHLGRTPQSRQAVAPTPPLEPPMPTLPPTAHVFWRCWDAGADPAGTVVETYLHGRGLYLPDAPVLRFHPKCQRGPSSLPGGPLFAPAMLALMVNPKSSEPVGVHRTFLLPDGSGKAPIVTRGDVILPAKSVLGAWGSVRFPPPAETRGALALGERIENALTAQQCMQWELGPVWAAGSAVSIAQFPVLRWATSLTIFADADDAGVGIRAARTCEARWRQAGRHVELRIPPAGHDWNSALRWRAR